METGHVCPWWLAYTFDNPLRALLHKPEQMLSPYVREGMTAADIGCGMGFFSIGLAKIVKDRGKVIAVDVQAKMLEKVKKRAQAAGLTNIIHPHQCDENNIGVAEPVDFALAFWMVHETPDAGDFFRQVHGILKRGGLLLVAEPKFHVSRLQFNEEIDMAQQAGFGVKDAPRIAFSNSALLEKR